MKVLTFEQKVKEILTDINELHKQNGEDFISFLHTTINAYLINKYEFLYPQTLNDFIRDTQRANIELQ